MPRTQLRDIIVVLPGITGSVLYKGDNPFWDISAGVFFQYAKTHGNSLAHLRLAEDDPKQNIAPDGVVAKSLMSSHGIPGLVKIDGYSELYECLDKNFQLIKGNRESEKPENYFEFAYDWRRDNRVSARLLKELVDKKLPKWRERTGVDSKVILVGHSMGGLISRYFLEVLGGWEYCRALITFGTPYRGSVNAVQTLIDGLSKGGIELTSAVRSMPSMYQLLPNYKMTVLQNTLDYFYNLVLECVDQNLLSDARLFHQEISDAVKVNSENSRYNSDGYSIIPYVGIDQNTLQSVEVNENRILRYSKDLPIAATGGYEGGDGTVPKFSAMPKELLTKSAEVYIAEKHSSLQANNHVLRDLVHRLKRMQDETAEGLEGGIEWGDEEKETLSLDVEDLFVNEPVKLKVLANSKTNLEIFGIIRPRLRDGAQVECDFERKNAHWEAQITNLPPGLYQVTVRSKSKDSSHPLPVHDLFEVAT